jgi:hypothetical protein
MHSPPTSQIEEVVETHILQVTEVANTAKEEPEFPQDIFQVLATKKKCEDKASK